MEVTPLKDPLDPGPKPPPPPYVESSFASLATIAPVPVRVLAIALSCSEWATEYAAMIVHVAIRIRDAMHK